MSESGKCPFTGVSASPVAGRGTTNRDWWPNQLNLGILHQHAPASNPMGPGFATPRSSGSSTSRP